VKRTVPLFACMAMLAACGHKAGRDGGGGNGPGERCTVQSECASGLCVSDPASGLGFCSAPCKKPSDCNAGFPDGCCVSTSDASQLVCAIAALCSHGDAGLGDACPGAHDECANGLVCLFSQNGPLSECSQPCATSDDCGGVAQECCEDLSSTPGQPARFCVLDPACNAPPDAGPTFDAGPSGPRGDDGGPFYAALFVDGTLTADTSSYAGSVGPNGDELDAPPLGRNLTLGFRHDLTPGRYGCSDGGGSALPDSGALFAALDTRPTDSRDFAARLPSSDQGLIVPLQCGAGLVFGGAGFTVQSAFVDVQRYRPGRVRTLDAGPLAGQVTGTAGFLIRPSDGGARSLELRARFDVTLTPP
jgi:hypothetical protein